MEIINNKLNKHEQAAKEMLNTWNMGIRGNVKPKSSLREELNGMNSIETSTTGVVRDINFLRNVNSKLRE